jgi:hypothetical protein
LPCAFSTREPTQKPCVGGCRYRWRRRHQLPPPSRQPARHDSTSRRPFQRATPGHRPPLRPRSPARRDGDLFLRSENQSLHGASCSVARSPPRRVRTAFHVAARSCATPLSQKRSPAPRFGTLIQTIAPRRGLARLTDGNVKAAVVTCSNPPADGAAQPAIVQRRPRRPCRFFVSRAWNPPPVSLARCPTHLILMSRRRPRC